MADPPLTLRCTRCGGWLSAMRGPSATTQYVSCPHCGSPVPVVPPRDPAPLFAWEVYPYLYPPLPLPRPPPRSARPFTVGSLLVAAALVWLLAGVTLYGGAVALTPHQYRIAGVVEGPAGTLAGASVNLTGENGFHEQYITGTGGAFDFTGVPSGAVTLSANASGYVPTEVDLFVSPAYVAAGGSPQAVVIPVEYGSSSASANVVSDSAFVSLEDLVTSLWSGTVVWLLAGVVVVLGVLAFARSDRPTRGVVAASASLASPVVLLFLNVSLIYPWLTFVAAVVAALGAGALVVVLVPMALVGKPPDYRPIG
ncbi:MAG: carboxypeptidase-like regulatory domain-containing protein [Thermoplasmata archaeon]